MSNRTRSRRIAPAAVRSLRAAVEFLEGRQLLSSYYIGSGTGPEGAVSKTLAQINAMDLNTGDEILFQAGQTFTGSLELDRADKGGITIRSHGTGRATIEAGASFGILVQDIGNVVVSNLVLKGTKAQQTPELHSGIEFRNNLSGTDIGNPVTGDVELDNITIQNVDVSGFGNAGVLIKGTAAKSGFRNVLIDHVKAHGNIHAGIASLGKWDNTSLRYAHHNVTVQYSEASGNTGYAGSGNHTGDGIVMADIDGVDIVRNVAFNNGELNTHVGGPVGVWVWDVNDAYIAYNESHSNKTNSTADGGGFDFDGGVTNSVMEYNYSHDNHGAGYGIYQFGGARSFYNNHVRYNVSVDDGRKNSYGAIDFWNGDGSDTIKDTYVYNNTVYVSASYTGTYDRKGKPIKAGDPRALRFISGTEDVKVFNNNFYATDDVLLAQVDAKQTNLQMNGNNWYSQTPANFKIKIFAKVYTTLKAYQSGTGHDLAGKSVNPGFRAVSKPTYTTATVGNWGTALDWLRPTNVVLSGASVAFTPATSSSRVGPPYASIPWATDDFYGTDLPAKAAVGASEVVTLTA